MYICDNNHEKIVYLDKYCPVCELLLELEVNQREILSLAELCDNLDMQYSELITLAREIAPEILL